MKKRNYKKIAIIVVVLWGAVLAVGGALNGNHAALTPDLSHEKAMVLEKQISSNAFNCWLTNERSEYTLVEFAEEGACTTELQAVKRYACLDPANLQDLKWIRTTFKSMDRQMILYNRNPEQNLHASALLSHYGYNVRMLKDTVDIAGSKDPAAISIQPVTSNQPVTSVMEPISPAGDFDQGFEEEEAEEEGC